MPPALVSLVGVPTLIAREGPLAGRRFELDDEVVLGREGATITLNDEETSRRHAAIRVVADKATIEDLGSTTGTFVDGRRIDAPTELKGGETIKLGQTVFYVEVPVKPEPEVDSGATRLAHAAPIVDADATRLRPRPAKPEPEAPPEPDATRLRPRPVKPEPAVPADSGRTSLRPRPATPAASPAPAPPPPRTPAPAVPAPAGRAVANQPFGAFAPPAGRRRGGVASRKLAPSLVSFAAIILTAVALVVYFVGR